MSFLCNSIEGHKYDSRGLNEVHALQSLSPTVYFPKVKDTKEKKNDHHIISFRYISHSASIHLANHPLFYT